MKTNLEEFNYRFRKELLNNYGYRLFFKLRNEVETASLNSDFSYSAWVKGLAKKEGKEQMDFIDILETLLDEKIEVYFSVLDEKYERGDSFVDYLNMPEIVSRWVSLFYENNENDETLWNVGLTIATSERTDKYFKFFRENNVNISKEDFENGSISQKVKEINKKWVTKIVTEKLS